MNTQLNTLESDEEFAAQEFFRQQQRKVYKNTSYLFAILMPLQWLASIFIAFLISPQTWNGAENKIHPHIWTTVIFGGLITSLPVFFAVKFPESFPTRNVVAVGQMMMSAMLIHVTGGRIETHFHIFGSLAFLSFYRDWRVLIPATVVTAGDHIFRGWFYPQSIYGILTGGEWRWIEHAAWVVFETIFLIASCRFSVKEMWQIAVNSTALNRNEARYRAVVEQMSEGICLLDPKTFHVIECNEAFVELVGCKNIEETKQLTAMDFAALGFDKIEKMAEIARKKGHSITVERKFHRRDGSLLDVELTGRFISYNNINSYCLNARNISARRHAEDEIRRLALVAQKTENSVIIFNAQSEIQWVNESFKKITKYELNEVIGRKPSELLQGAETNPETLKAIREAISQRKSFTGEIYNYDKTGKGFWLSKSITPFHNSKGEFEGFISVAMDITARKEMEEALRFAHGDLENRVAERTAELVEAHDLMMKEVNERKRAEAGLKAAQSFLRNVIDSVPNLIFVKDEKGRYILANRAIAEIYGIESEEMIGKTDAQLAHNSVEAEQFQNDDLQVIENWQEKFIFDEKITDSSGGVHWLHTVKRPIFDDSGVKSILGVCTDLTERKILESQLRHAQKLESIGQLAAGIAHEINTPTQYVGDNTRFVRDAFEDLTEVLEKYGELLEAAREEKVTSELLAQVEKEIDEADLEYIIEEVPNAVQQSLEGINRIANIVQSMKDFAHPGSRDKTAADINKAIESTITVARNEWKYVAELETHFDNNLPPVPCLLGEFNQVILNIVINASQSISDVVGDGSHGKGKIVVTTTKAGDDWAEIRISDSGTGIPPEVQSRIFDPFFTTKDVGKGTGQGLAISHSVIVDKHKGKLKFETEHGKGTTFIIQLPFNPEGNLNTAEGSGK